ncbi:MAG: hypothetical protein GY856_33755, partial [bacterium]|nr:hypothetical protein [bacterium]
EQRLTAAGIPWDPVLFGGQPRSYELERVWCEVWLPYGNFRGVMLDETGATWLGLDAHLKSMAGPPESVLEQMAFDAGSFADSYLTGGFCTPPLESPGACPLPSEVLAAQVDSFLGAQGYATASLPRELIEQHEELLPTAMVGAMRSVSGFGLELPEELQHRLELVAREGQRVLFADSFATAELAGREATLWFIPATAEDEELVEDYGGSLWFTPPYLVNSRLELRAGGESLAEGQGAIGMGLPFELEITLRTPGGDTMSFANELLSGVPAGLGIAPGGQGYAPPFGEPTNTPEVLAKLAGDYLDAVAGFQQEAASLDAVEIVHPFPSVVMVASVVEPQGSFGLVERLAWKGIYTDADVFGARAVGRAGNTRRWLELAQLEASARERRLFEDWGIAAISADLALVLAADRGIEVLHIDRGNLVTILPSLPFDAAVTSEIEGWVLAGGEAYVPAQTLDFIEWS